MKVDFDNRVVKLYNIPINENIASWIEQDILIPDSKPDAIKIVNVNAMPFVCSFEVLDDKVKIVGKINYSIVYKTEENNYRGLCFTYPFTNILNLKNISKNMKIYIKPCIKNIIYSLPNERKMLIKTEILFNVSAIEFIDVNFINKFKNNEYMQCKENKINLCNNTEYKEHTITSKEDILMPKEAEDFYEIVKYDAKIINTDYKESYNKIMVKGDISIDIMYLSVRNEYKKFKCEIPFTSMVELQNITDDSHFDVSFYLSSFFLNVNEEDKMLNVNYIVNTYARMYENEDISYISDFYNVRNDIKYNEKKYNLVCKNNVINKSFEIKENINNIISEGSSLIDYTIDTNNLNIKHFNNEVSVTGSVKINLLLKKGDTNELENKIIDIEVNEKLNIEGINKDSFVYFNISLDKINILPNGNDLEIKIRLNVEIKEDNVIDINCIENVELEEIKEADESSMYLYIVKKGDTLWSIAKKYKTTIDKIVATNNIENKDDIKENEKILIIR